MTKPFYCEKFFLCAKWGKSDIFGFLVPKSIILNFSLNLFIRLFKNCTWWCRHWKVGQSDCSGFSRKIPIMPKWGEWVIFGPKINTFKFSSNLSIGFSWNCTWWQLIKSVLKGLVWIFKENSYYAKNWWDGSFFGPKLFFNFSLNLLVIFFCKCAWWKALKVG